MLNTDQLSYLTLDFIDLPIHVVDTDLRIRIFNTAFKRWCNRLGFKMDDAIGKTVFEMFPFLPNMVRDEYFQVLRNQVQLSTEEENVVDGKKVFTETHKFPLFENGKVTHVITVIADITGRKLAQAALRASRERYQQLFMTVLDAIVICNANTLQFVDINQSALDLYGYSRREFLNLNLWDITAEPKKTEASIEEARTRKCTRIPLRYHRKKDGTMFPVEISASVFTTGGEDVICGVIRDVTTRREVEKALEESEERFRSQFKSIPAPTYIWKKVDNDFVFTDFNAEAATFTSGNVSLYIGKTASEMHRHQPDIIEDMRECLNKKTTIRREMVYRFMSSSYEKYLDVHYVYISPDQVLVHTVDLTDRKRDEEALRNARDDLEKSVLRRTMQLAQANEALKAEREALKQKNIVLQEVLNQIDKGKEDLASQIQLNIDRITLPILNTLEHGLSQSQKRLMSLLRSSLLDITSPFISSLEAKFPRLTPRELEICQMVKAGSSCKEISDSFNISLQTVLKHRAFIRKKLGISHRRVNLVSFLRSLK